MQRFSVFHGSSEGILKGWHQPYTEIFASCNPVLDVGCGLGYFADLMRDLGVQCIGLDIDPAMVKASEGRGHVAHVGDHRSLRSLSTEFGGIHISHVVEHLWGEELVELLEQCAAVLRAGGRIVIRTPNWENTEVRHRMFWSDYSHRRPYNVEVLSKLLKDLGFSIEAAGAEPYGHNDLFVVATKGAAQPRSAVLDFSRDPFPHVPLKEKVRRRIPRWLKVPLRLLRNLFTGRREQA